MKIKGGLSSKALRLCVYLVPRAGLEPARPYSGPRILSPFMPFSLSTQISIKFMKNKKN
jgi:hypothetical protein